MALEYKSLETPGLACVDRINETLYHTVHYYRPGHWRPRVNISFSPVELSIWNSHERVSLIVTISVRLSVYVRLTRCT